MKFKEIVKNKRLTDFKETREIVISNNIKNVPEIKKSNDNTQQQWFSKY